MPDLIDQAMSEAMAQLEAEPEVPEAPVVEGDAEVDGETEVEDDSTEEAETDGEPEGEPDVEDDAEVDEEGDAQEDDEGTEVDGPVAVTDDATYRLADGTEVSGAELKDGWLRQADYTRKTQELATQRTEVESLQQRMVDWYEERAGNPAEWITEIAAETDNPAATIADALGADKDPTNAVAWVLRSLAERGKLSDDFVKQFGLEGFADKASSYEADTKLSRLERQVQEERDARQKAEQERTDGAKTQTILADYERQWASIVQTEGLTYDSPKREFEDKLAVMRFARDNEIPNLEHAYAAYARTQPKAKAKSNVVAKETVERKRKAKAVSAKAPPAGPAPRKAGDIEAAMREAAGELGMTHLT